VLYAGWVASAVFMLYVVRRRQATGLTRFAAVPQGFESAVTGAVLFGFGGVGDMIWHGVFGIEVELKILFSPTHLVLMTAMLMLAFGPVRSSWLSNGRSTIANLWPAILSTGVIMSVLLVFFQYLSAFDRGVFTTEVPKLLGLEELIRVQAIAGVIVFTLLFFGPMLFLARRFKLPLGAGTLAFAVPAVCNYIFTDFKAVRLSVAILVGGVAVDAMFALTGRISAPRLSFRLSGALAPLAFWGTYLAVTLPGNSIEWPAELWTGTVAWSTLVGAAVTVALLPPRGTPGSWTD